jgi:hypothetical protein
MFRHVRSLAAFVAAPLLLISAASASVIWDGDASKGKGVFKAYGTGNVESPATLDAVSDSTQGMVWRYHKPSGSNRSETHGCRNGSTNVVFNNGNLYYLGWRNRITNTTNNNAVFQWKAYGSNMTQNFPLVLKIVSGQLRLQYTPPGGNSVYIWSGPINTSSWYHQVLAIRVSTSASTGYVEFWRNGTKQTFTNGSQRYMCRTLDAEHCCPKWGIYGASTTTITNYVDGLKVGTTYGDVD